MQPIVCELNRQDSVLGEDGVQVNDIRARGLSCRHDVLVVALHQPHQCLATRRDDNGLRDEMVRAGAQSIQYSLIARRKV